MTKNKTRYLIAGFFLFLLGFLAIVLQFVGLQLTFLVWLDAAGNLFGFVLRLLMVIAGIVLAAWASIDTEKEEIGNY
jgi:uncharacterized metal-binding protein